VALNSTVNSITCLVPSSNIKDKDTTCELIINENGLVAQNEFKYLVSLTPTLSSVSPLKGGTGGGSVLTITGTNFP